MAGSLSLLVRDGVTFEGGDGAGLVVLHVEDGIELGDLEQVVGG